MGVVYNHYPHFIEGIRPYQPGLDLGFCTRMGYRGPCVGIIRVCIHYTPNICHINRLISSTKIAVLSIFEKNSPIFGYGIIKIKCYEKVYFNDCDIFDVLIWILAKYGTCRYVIRF